MTRFRLGLTLVLMGGFIVATHGQAPNLALSAQATASEHMHDLTPERAIDGSGATRWSGISGHNTGVWFALEWTQPVEIAEVIVQQYDAYVMEMDVQVWDEATADWRTLQHLGRPNRRLPRIVVVRFDPVRTRKLRLAEITNGPSFTEVAVYEAPASGYPLELRLASDLHGNFIGVATDPWGAAPVEGAAVELAGQCAAGPFRISTHSDAQGMFTAEMPLGLSGKLQAALEFHGNRHTTEFDAAALPYGLSPESDDQPVLDLSGIWKFLPDPPEDFASPAKSDKDWSDIRVPAHWLMEGFRTRSGVAAYRTTFKAPRGAGRIKLRFDGVFSGAEVFVNGTRLAYHEGGATPFEIDATESVHAGENLLALRVSERTYTSENFDKMSEYADFHLGGIMRKVVVFRVPETHLGQIALTTPLTEEGARITGSVDVWNEAGRPFTGTIIAELRDPSGAPVPLAVPPAPVAAGAWQRGQARLDIPVAAPLLWDAEHPHLYTLTLALLEDGKPVQRVTRKLGFRQVEVRGPQFLINGKPVKLRGTCYHASHPLLGRAVSPELTRLDMEMIVAANLNALRTSHYPPLPELLEFTDEMGLYVMDEAPFCWTSVSSDLRNMPAVVQLTAEMVARDRNHPSIVMWSTCNESSWGYVFDRSAEWIKRTDPSRPRSAGLSAWLDVANRHNPLSIARIDRYEDLDMPMLFDESLCIWQGIWGDVAEMWVDPGVRDYYGQPLVEVYERFISARATQGSYIWCWQDDIFCVPGRGLEYGRGSTRSHFLEPSYYIPGRGLVGDAPWGVVDGWRREKPEFFITRKLHSPVKVKVKRIALPSPGQPLRVQVVNEHDFTNLAEMEIRWRLGQEWGTLTCDLPPYSTGELRIAPKAAPSAGDRLTLQFRNARGRLVDTHEVVIGEAPAPLPAIRAVPTSPLSLRESSFLAGRSTDVLGEDFEFVVDHGGGYGNPRQGQLRRLVAYGRHLLLDYPRLHLLPTRDAERPVPVIRSWAVSRYSVKLDGDNAIVTLEGRYDDFEGGYTFTITPAAQLLARYRFTYLGEDMRVRELGWRMDLPRDCDLLQWHREGEFTAYPEDHVGRTVGMARAFPQHAHAMPPAWPWALDLSPMGCNDFRSTKRNIHWASLRFPDGPGILIQSNGAQHARAMMRDDRICLHVNDWYGGTNCGLGEWVMNYGEGRLIRKGEVLESALTVQLYMDMQ